MHLLAFISLAVAQPGIQPQTNLFGRNRDPFVSFGVSSYVQGPNPCKSILECRTCTAAIGCVWSGTYCYQVKYQQTTCQGSGCATSPSQCLTTSSTGPSNPARVPTCDMCKGGSSTCPTGMVCQLGSSACAGTCQPTSTACDYGEAYDTVQQKCIAISCVAANACPSGYTCNTNPCYRYPCPVVCTAPSGCNACGINTCPNGRVCQTDSNSYSSCQGTCVDSIYQPSSSCYSLSTCTDCTTVPSSSGYACVWNGVQCYPSNFPCSGRECTTTPGRCPTTCDATDCGTCTSQGCVWTQQGGCLSISASQCDGLTCAISPSECAAQQSCPTLTTCNTCLQFNGCLWSGSRCFFSSRPCDGSNCVATCTDYQQSCNVGDCMTCVSTNNCQWNGATRTCYYSTVPCTATYCASTQSQCNAASPCSSLSTCLDCAAVTGCLWHSDTCYSIPCSGPSCSMLGYTSQCPQPTCSGRSTCVDCVNTDGCLWTGASCYPKTSANCANGGCVTYAQQCPESGCAYGEVYNPYSRTCVATSCASPTACPAGYSCQTQTGCGSYICPVVCTPPASQCGPNEQWTSCASSTCFESVCFETDYATRVCAQDCRSGCQCMPGFARYQGSCISGCPHY